MRKTKSTTILLLILAILALGIGYAAASRTLQINGTLGAKADDANFKVEFTAATHDEPIYVSTTAPVIAQAVDATDKELATFSVTGFTCKNDFVVIRYTVENKSTDLDATVTTADLANFTNKEYFSVTSSFAAASSVTTTTIAAGDTATLYVTVTCIKTPIADVASAETEGIVTLTATAVEH